MKKDIVTISAKNLGQLALPDYCPRCFWLKLKMGFNLPFQIFPGIFSTIDSYSKKITWSYYEKYKKVPPWFSEFGEFTGLVPPIHHRNFSVIDSKTGIKLTGVPDEIFKMKDGRFFIIDYKTAKFTNTQDSLLPMYVVQLNSYAYIFEKIGMGEIGGLGLVYYEPQGNAPTVSFDTVLLEDGFDIPFRAHLKKIKLDSKKVVLPLLKVVRKYAEMEKVPKGRRGCEDCEVVERMIDSIGP